MPKELYDWLDISKQYIQGITTKDANTGHIKVLFPTHEELCDKHGCSLITIRTKAQKDKWLVQRAQFKRKLKIKTSEVRLDDLIGEGTKFDSYHLQSLEKVQKLIDDFLDPYIKMINGTNDGYDTNEDIKPLSIRELKDITSIIKESHITVKSILGDSDTSSLLDDIREETLAQRKNKEVSKTRLKELAKQLNDAEKLKEELELRKKEIQKKLSE
jgi:hypothetical protein